MAEPLEHSSTQTNPRTYVYKTVGDTSIEVDVILPNQIKYVTENDITVMLYIHVGGWIAGSRLEYPQIIVYEALSQGWVFASMDHRLLPETSFVHGQLEDIRDIETWLRDDLLERIDNKRSGARIGDIMVTGASSGGHLALLTPKLWSRAPTAIISLYGPTNMRNAKGLTKGPRSKFPLPDFTPEILHSITCYDKPPTNIEMISAKGFNQRMLLGMHIIRQGTIAEFLLRGLGEDDAGIIALPRLGAVSSEEIDSISPLCAARELHYPPTCQVIGSDDDMFDLSHVTDLAAVFEETGVPHKELFVPDAGHGFDMGAAVDDNIHLNFIQPAVRWASQFIGKHE